MNMNNTLTVTKETASDLLIEGRTLNHLLFREDSYYGHCAREHGKLTIEEDGTHNTFRVTDGMEVTVTHDDYNGELIYVNGYSFRRAAR